MAKKRLQKWLALCLAVSMLMGTTAMAVDAPEQTTELVEVETEAGKKETIEVVVEVEKVDDVTKKTGTAENFETGSGANVDYEGSSEFKDDGTGSSESKYTVKNGDYTAEGGSESTAEKVAPNGITVDVPLTSEEGKNKNTETSENKPGDIIDTTGDPKESDEDGVYDYTQTVVKDQGSVTVETKEITVTENVINHDTELTHVKSETDPTKTNDLITELPSVADFENAKPEAVEGYNYVYAGTENTSQFRPAVVFTEPLSDADKLEKFGDGAYIPAKYIKYFPTDLAVPDGKGGYVTDEAGYLLDANGNRIFKEEKTVVGPDGTTYYLHRVDNLGTAHNVEGWHQDGKWLEELNGDKYGVVYATAQQFVLLDHTTGETVTVYCADVSTVTQDGFGYNIENLEDADYYTDEQAAKIRTIAANGYWGAAEGEVGSLDAMKEMLLASGEFTEEELASLTDGVALTATQMAIWSCSNHMEGAEFINTHYVGTPDMTEIDGGGTTGMSNVPKEKEDEAKLMFKLYEYLKALAPIEVENPTTQNTIINADNFLKDMSVTVVEKAQDHVNNKDDDDKNDAYVTDLTFALVVTPSTENGDDLIVKVLNAKGEPVAEGRIAGEAREGDKMLYADENGNYTFKGITMIEGDQNFNITLEGVQNLQEGVYLYSSEVRTDDGGDETSSQTMVGLAKGKRDVNVEMNIRFELDVEDEVIATERYWRAERTDGDDDDTVPPGDDDDTPKGDDDDDDTVIGDDDVPLDAFPGDDDDNTPGEDEIVDEDVPLEELPKEDVPLADVPKTGDASLLWFALSVLSGAGLAGLNSGRKREDEE